MNTPRNYPAKPALTLDEQIDRLRVRGMEVPSIDRARHYLAHLNYYRLRGYWMHLEYADDGGAHIFLPGTNFDQIIALYDFDRNLRMLVNDAVERVEVSLRTRLAFVLGHIGGPCSHRNAALFNEHHGSLISKIEKLYAERKEIFLKHYLDRNEEPPIWALCEAMSLSDLSKWLRSIRDRKTRQLVSDAYGLKETPFCSFVENLAYVRNLCAHHGRLWNRNLIVGAPSLPKKPDELVVQMQRDPLSYLKVYNTLTMLAWLMQAISPGSEWRSRVMEHVDSRGDLWREMGFPDDWKLFPLWRQS